MRDDDRMVGVKLTMGRMTVRLLFGLVLVTLGALWTLDNLGFVDSGTILRWWPALLLGYGLMRLSGVDGRRRPMSGTLFTIAGAWLLAQRLGWVQVSLFQLWPVFLIAVGASIVWRSQHSATVFADVERGDHPRPFALFGGVTSVIESQALVGAEVTAIMGGVELDLRGARAQGDTVVVETLAFWGGIEIIVPEHWTVVSEISPVMGGVENRTRRLEGGQGPTLLLRGLAIMGGVEVRNTHRRDRDVRGVRVGVTRRSRGGDERAVHVVVERRSGGGDDPANPSAD